MRVNPLIVALGLLGLFAASMLIGYVGGQAFLAPAKSASRTPRAGTPPPVAVETPVTPAAPLGPSRGPEVGPPAPAPVAPTPAPGTTVSPSKPTASAPAPPGANYRVQAGAFQRRENAEARMAQLRQDGYEPYLVTTGGLLRVIVGAFSDRENADRLVAQLRARGYDALVLPVR